jgi:hypothetical protein
VLHKILIRLANILVRTWHDSKSVIIRVRNDDLQSTRILSVRIHAVTDNPVGLLILSMPLFMHLYKP